MREKNSYRYEKTNPMMCLIRKVFSVLDIILVKQLETYVGSMYEYTNPVFVQFSIVNGRFRVIVLRFLNLLM